MQEIDISGIQGLIEKLDGVLAAKIVQDDNGGLSEIHVLADKSRPPKQMSRDIQSAIAAASGLCVEHRIISIAQTGGGMEVQIPAQRPKLMKINISRENTDFSAVVDLSCGVETYSGTAQGSNNFSSRLRTIAAACLDALNKLVSAKVFSVNDVAKTRLSNADVVNVGVDCCIDGYENKLLTGSALVSGDEYEAVVKAALDAANRIIAKAAS